MKKLEEATEAINFVSEVLVLGLIGDSDKIILLQPERKAEKGIKVA